MTENNKARLKYLEEIAKKVKTCEKCGGGLYRAENRKGEIYCTFPKTQNPVCKYQKGVVKDIEGGGRFIRFVEYYGCRYSSEK